MSETPLPERAQQLLKILIERYIKEGQPIGSKSLATDLALSSATIRHVMADLEELGYLISPHTSAGRIPTAKGYRLFVDTLLSVQPLDELSISKVIQELGTEAQKIPVLIENASSILSEFTRLAGVVSMPKRDSLVLKQIEFLPLSDNRILTIVVLNDKEIQNRIIYTEHTYPREALQQAANFINSKFVNCDLKEIRKRLLNSMRSDREVMDEKMSQALHMADQALAMDVEDKHGPFVLAGQNNLFDLADSAGIGALKELFDAFSEKQHVLHLIDKCLETEGVQIYIGEESGYEVFQACSLVGAPYSVDGKIVGVLGVIGPTRMPYDKVIPVVDVTAKLLGQILGSED